MLFGRNKKAPEDMTKAELIASLIVFSLIGIGMLGTVVYGWITESLSFVKAIFGVAVLGFVLFLFFDSNKTLLGELIRRMRR